MRFKPGVGLLVMAADRHLTGDALDEHAAVELGEFGELRGRHPIVDERLHRVDVTGGE